LGGRVTEYFKVLLLIVVLKPLLGAKYIHYLKKNIMEINMPVSDNVWPHLNAYLQTLPPGIAKQISVLQFDVNNSNQTLAVITRALNSAKNQRNAALGSLIIYYTQTDTLAPLINILEQEHTPQANSILFGTYLNQGNISLAQQKLAQLPQTNAAETALVNLYNLYLILYQQQRTLFEMDSLEVMQVRTIANICPVNPAAYYAQVVIKLVFGEEPVLCPSNARLAAEIYDLPFAQPNTAYYLGNNIPNPFSGKTIIPYLLPDGSEKAVITIVDITGRLIKQYELSPNEKFLEIKMDDYQNGIYLYELRIGEKIFQTKRMVLSN